MLVGYRGLTSCGLPSSRSSSSDQVKEDMRQHVPQDNCGGYLTADLELEPGIPYQLVETEAPEGYELLPTPVTFTIARQTDGSYKLQIQDSGAVSNVVAVDAAGDSNLRLLKVTDVRRGELPHTGGSGVHLPILFGGALIAAGAPMSRRKAAA